MRFGQGSKFDIKFKNNDALMRLIYINAAVFIGTILVNLPFWLMNSEMSPKTWVKNWFAVPSNLGDLIIKPWTIITYMFLHIDFWHVLINMLWLYFLGRLFVQFLGSKKLVSVYIAGGIAGALLYIISFNIFPVFSTVAPIALALGASASVMAIVVAIATYTPDFIIRLFIFGNVKLKYIAIVVFVLDLVGISNSNSGGHLAHIGGAILGYLFAMQWKKGKDITAWVDKSIVFIQALAKPSQKSRMKVKYKRTKSDFEYQDKKKEEQEVIDHILDKISKSGYDSLSKTEKEILFRASNK